MAELNSHNIAVNDSAVRTHDNLKGRKNSEAFTTTENKKGIKRLRTESKVFPKQGELQFDSFVL